MSRNYDFLAIDLDGTLLGPDHDVSQENIAAIRAAKAAGLRVSVCTGRGFNESKHITSRLDQTDPVVVAGGAILADGRTGRTIHRFPMHEDLVRRLTAMLVSHGHAALLLKDPSPLDDSGIAPGHEYLIVSPRGWDAVEPVTRWWLTHHGINVHLVPDLGHDEHPELTVRVGVCGTKRGTQLAADQLRNDFAGEVTLHHFGAVVNAGNPNDPGDTIVILEAFDRSVNKWSAVRWLAEREGIDPCRVAAIGNDVNDVALLEGAGLGVAMGNAIAECLAVADQTTLDHASHGVAHAIGKILAGEW